MQRIVGAQWEQIFKLNDSVVQAIFALYQKPFSPEVRNHCSIFIEDRFLDCNLDPENVSHHPFIAKLIEDLNNELKTRASMMSSQDLNFHVARVRLMEASNMIVSQYPMTSVQLYRHICYCLNAERELIRLNCQPESARFGIPDMSTKCNELEIKIAEISHILKAIQTNQELVNNNTNHLKKWDAMLRLHRAGSLGIPDPIRDVDVENPIRCQIKQVEQHNSLLATDIDVKRNELIQKQQELIKLVTETQMKVIQILNNWKDEQRTTMQFTISIEEIQKWFEALATVLIYAANQTREMSIPQQSNSQHLLTNGFANHTSTTCNDYKTKIAQLFAELIQNAYVVEIQPYQVIKKGTKFSVTIRFLIGQKLNLPNEEPINVNAYILNEAGAKEYQMKNGVGRIRVSGELTNSKQKFQLDGGTSRYIAEFKNLNVKNAKHNEKKESGHSVLDESFWLLFQTELIYNKTIYKVSSLSVPIKVTTHVNQEAQAWETLVWDEAGPEENGCKPWAQVARALSNKFVKMTKRPLSAEHLVVLRDKAFEEAGRRRFDVNDSTMLSWTKFCKTKLPGKEFTFWNWFFEIAKLTSEHLSGDKLGKSGPWQDGLIAGLIGREGAEAMLRGCAYGTFLLRFSDSMLGGISISWVHNNGSVMSVNPFNSNDLKVRSLPEILMDINYLHYLYPNIPKLQAFPRYASNHPANSQASGGDMRLTKSRYVRTLLRTELLIDDQCFPSSPSSNPQSPDNPDVDMISSLQSPIDNQFEMDVPQMELMAADPMFMREFEGYLFNLCENAYKSLSPETPGEGGYFTADEGSLHGEQSPADSCASELEYCQL